MAIKTLNEAIEVMRLSFLFRGISDEEIMQAINSITYKIESFCQGDCIYEPKRYEEKIGLVLKGECTVERKRSDGSSLPLNSLKIGDSFGILAIFSNEDFPTVIKAKRNSDILFISKKDCEYLIKKDHRIAFNMLKFMSNRIAFLNKKIATFSADNVEQKLAQYLIIESQKTESNVILMNCKKTAEQINAGRASLYRAIDSLCDRELIKFENKKIYILDQNCLERITQ